MKNETKKTIETIKKTVRKPNVNLQVDEFSVTALVINVRALALKQMARALGIKQSGKKQELAQRIFDKIIDLGRPYLNN